MSQSPLPQLTLVVQGSSNPLVLVCSAFPFLSPLPHLGDHGLGDHGLDNHGFDDDR